METFFADSYPVARARFLEASRAADYGLTTYSLRVKTLVIITISLLVCAGPAAIGQAQGLRDAAEFHARGGLPNAFAKLKAGKAVRIAYLGGSITEQNGWRPKTLDWFKKRYPAASITEINAAIGGTGSDLGVYRLQQDVLTHKPDLLFVEFAVNDGGAAPERILKAMEGIVRQTWRADRSTDICFVYTLTGPHPPFLFWGEEEGGSLFKRVIRDRFVSKAPLLGL